MSGILLLLSACAKQNNPSATTPQALASPTAAPTIALPSPMPLEAAAEPLSPNQTLADAVGPTDLSIQVPEMFQLGPDDTAVYTLTVHNHGPAAATDIVLTHSLPAGLVPAWTPAAGPVCGRQAQSVQCDVGALYGGDAVTVTLDLSSKGTEELITGTQLAGVDMALNTLECDIGQTSGRTQVLCTFPYLAVDARRGIRFTLDTGAPNLDSTLQAAVTAHHSDLDRTNNQQSFTLPDQLAPATTPDTPAASTIPGPNLIVQTNGPDQVIAGQPVSYTFTINNQGNSPATGVFFYSALPPATELLAYAPTRPQCHQQDDRFNCTLYEPESGQTLSFTLLLDDQNQEPVIVELDPLMPGWPVCTVLKERTFLHILLCELGTLQPGQAHRVEMTLAAEGIQERSIDVVASVSSEQPDSDPTNDTITTTAAVGISADLLLWSELDPTAGAGQTLSYTLNIANQGPSDAARVHLTDTVPAGVRLLSAVGTGNVPCSQENWETTGALTCNLGRLNSGMSTTVTITLSLDAWNGDLFSHTTQVQSDQTDPRPEDNQLIEDISIQIDD